MSIADEKADMPISTRMPHSGLSNRQPQMDGMAQGRVIGALRSRPRRALTVASHLAMLAAIGILV